MENAIQTLVKVYLKSSKGKETLGKKDFQNLVKTQLGNILSDADSKDAINNMAEGLDANHDGKVGFPEYMKLIGYLATSLSEQRSMAKEEPAQNATGQVANCTPDKDKIEANAEVKAEPKADGTAEAAAPASVGLSVNVPKVEGPKVDLSKVEGPSMKVEVPKVEVPKVEGPTVEVPKVEGPTVDLSKVEVPTVDLSKVEVPTVDLSKVEVPKVDLSKVEVPSVDLSKVEVPSVELEGPTVEVPKIEVPKVEVPKVDVPTVEVEVPKAEVEVKADGDILKKATDVINTITTAVTEGAKTEEPAAEEKTEETTS